MKRAMVHLGKSCGIAVWAGLLLGLMAAVGNGQDAPPAAGQESPRAGHLVRVPLPITSQVVGQVRQTVRRLAEAAPDVVRPDDRTVVVLEFDTSDGRTGRGSELGQCLELARELSGPGLAKKIRTIAYIPGPSGTAVDGKRPTSHLYGHAVLVAIAANELILHPEASLGKASIDEPDGDDTVAANYQAIARRRLTLPIPVVMSMVQPELGLYRVTTAEGVVYADQVELDRLSGAGEVNEIRTLSAPGQLAEFTSPELLEYRLVRRQAISRADLARELSLPPTALVGDPTLGREWDPVEIPVPSYLNEETAQWIIRALNQRKPNLILFRLNSRDSDPDACLRLAQYLVQYDSTEVRTVAYVTGELRGPAALIGLSCDHLVMAPGSQLLGPSEARLTPQELAEFRSLLEALALQKGKDWSLFAAALDPELTVNRYRHEETGQTRVLSVEEYERLGDRDRWAVQEPLPVAEGIGADLAEQLYLARGQAADAAALYTDYQLEGPPEELTPTLADQWLKKVAGVLSSPLIAPWLLFAAFFFISTEMSAPGIGVPGFLGTLCLVLFFWSQYLGGTADWLEILLFLTGVVFLLIEIFVIPGFGVFGIGGLIMVVVSIVLASQTFIVPQNSEQLARLPYSLLPVVGAGLGFVVALVALRNVLPNAPYLKRMMLSPPTRDRLAEEVIADRDAVVDWRHLEGHAGETVTRLFPAGKARIRGRVYDVISDGRMIDKGVAIEVAEVSGNRIVVRPVENA